MAAEWFYSHDNVRNGPVDLETLRLLVASGTVGAGALVWRKGMSAWSPAASIAELKSTPESCTMPAHAPIAARSPSPATRKASILPWIVGGAALVMLGLITVVVVVLVVMSRSGTADDSQNNERSYDEQLDKDAQEVRDAFKPYQGR